MDENLPGRPFPAAGCQHYRTGAYTVHSRPVHHTDGKALFFLMYLSHKSLNPAGDFPPLKLFYKAFRIFRPGEHFPEPHQAEAVMDTLLQNSPQPFLPFNQQHPGPFLICGNCSRQPRRTAPYHTNIIFFQIYGSFLCLHGYPFVGP